MRISTLKLPLAAATVLTCLLGFDAANGERSGNRRGDGGGNQSMSGPSRGGDTARNGGERSYSGSHDSGGTNQASGSQQRQTFYRGPDGDASNRGQSERGDTLRRGDQDFRAPDFDRNNSQQRRDNGNREQFDNRNNDNRQDTNRNDRDRDRDDFNRFGRADDDWRGRSKDIRDDWWRSYGRNVPFRSGWWDTYYGANWPVYSPWRYSRWNNRPDYWWTWTPADNLVTWLAFGWDRPRYWVYGPRGNVYYRDNYIYYDNNQYKTADDYYRQIYDLAHSVPTIDKARAEQMDWRPLGVFALTRENENDSQRAVQLAVSHEGIITGTYYNRENGDVHPVSGMVEEKSQRAAWAFADGERPELVFEASLFTLTQPEGTMMVHFGPSESDAQVWHTLRLEQQQSTMNNSTQPDGNRSLP